MSSNSSKLNLAESSDVSFRSAGLEGFARELPLTCADFFVPGDEQCFTLWGEYEMFDNIRAHSHTVAEVATVLAGFARELNLISADYAQAVRACALLHDLAKTHCLKHGGHHAQLGATQVMDCTGNPLLAQGVLHHIWWPFAIEPVQNFLSLAVLYSDKRVQHSQIVSLDQRLDDLLARYGKTEKIKSKIHESMSQARTIEKLLGQILEVDLNAHTVVNGRLVPGT